jgi:hypothetical protein
VPTDTPVTIPDVAPIVATAVLLLVHAVPDVGKLNADVLPTQMFVLPDIEPPVLAFTVILFVLKQTPEE